MHPIPLRTLLALALTIIAAPALRSANWSTLGEVHDLGPGITPGIAVDPAGTIHVVTMHDGAILHRQGDAKGRFGPAKSIPAPEGAAAYNSPHLVCDEQGVLHLVFERDYTRTSKKAWYTNRHGGAWKQPLLAIDRSGTERRVNYPRLAVDGSGVYIAGFIGGGSVIAKIVGATSAPAVVKTIETPLWVAHPLLHADGLLVVGRAGHRGHKLERYTRNLERRGEALLLSHGTPTKTGEPMAAMIDESGTVHVVGVTGAPMKVLWYTTNERAGAGRDVILGHEVGHEVSEFTYPVLLRDARGRIYVSYRNHATGESCLSMFDRDTEQFAPPVVTAPAIARRLRWNAHLAAAPGGGAYVVWDSDGRVYFRAVGEAAQRDDT